ncbi:DUF302 domain-containing protein [Paracoccus sp. (in: a-proteobacteria)]|uniref:DUF302 domain-containing protein n=1 Tax=Paracoccus sp. TaxID=267 RepID=UPI0026DEDAC6|nr:DUF302 domain-containing protein [Paracoccus sp. (in: a-proteobacteria)]MDO5648038.1 DUF302 domain-containing protein [Paracoccus sp. (in: a-proteobacteria)]
MKIWLKSVAFFLLAPPVAGDDLRLIASNADVRRTVARLVDAIGASGSTVFSIVDHGVGAIRVTRDIGESQLVIFGHPEHFTPIIERNRLAGLFLPLRILVFEDENRDVWIAYQDIPKRLIRLENIEIDGDIRAMSAALKDLSAAAAGR